MYILQPNRGIFFGIATEIQLVKYIFAYRVLQLHLLIVRINTFKILTKVVNVKRMKVTI